MKMDPSVLIPSGEAHIIIGFEPLETLRMVRKYAGKDTTVVYDPRPVYPLGVLQGIQQYPAVEDIAAEIRDLTAMALAVPAAGIAMEAGDSKSANIALLGAFSQLPDAPLSREDLEKILLQRFKGTVLEVNQRAFAMGCEAAGKGAGL